MSKNCLDCGSINAIAHECYEIAQSKGWGDGPTRSLPELLILIHCELSEAVEAYRDGYPAYYEAENGKPEGYLTELADVLIRTFDTLARLGCTDVEALLTKKMDYNKTRPYRHGGKVI